MNLFAYGTLMWPEILADVIGRSLESVPAQLSNARRLRVRDEVYPAVVPESGAQIGGAVYIGLTHTEMVALDRFEGPEYERRFVEVETPSGPIEAAVYFTSQNGLELLEKEEWLPEHLPPALVDRFRDTYKGWLHALL